jgi:signal transduction histidine kinase
VAETGTSEPRRLGDFLRDHREEILAGWERAVRSIGAARNLSRPVLLDHMSEFIDDLAVFVNQSRSGMDARPPQDNPRIHALERLEVGYNLSEVVEEYAILRRCIAGMAVRAPAVRSAEMPLLHQAIDQAISTSVVRYSAAHERTLRALDRISSTALKEHDVESLLPRLLDAFLETTASVDTVALSLRDGDGSLRVRAAVGYPPPGPVGERVSPGALSSRVEREGTIFLRDASADPAISASPTCAPGTHAIYGTPLTVGDEILGVMVMGSRSSPDFSEEDQLLFRNMVNRAAALIAHARLRVEAERRAEESLRVQEELRAALEFRDRMLGILSHDLRNPLGVILASAQTLERSVSEERQRRSLSRVINSARRIERLIRDLLDYTRARQESALPLSRREADMAEICRQAIDDLRVLHPGRDVRLEVQGDTQGSFDPDRAAQIVSNLVANALNYSPQDTPVEVSVRENGDDVLLEVHNQGAAIAPDLLPRIFDAFQRGAGGGGDGLGLGLYIVRRLVEAHGGSIEVRSEAPGGTRFSVRWPKRF